MTIWVCGDLQFVLPNFEILSLVVNPEVANNLQIPQTHIASCDMREHLIKRLTEKQKGVEKRNAVR